MRNRQMDANDDYVFGAYSKYLVNTPAGVAQAVRTKLRLFAKEWFLDFREGLNLDNILGYGTQPTRDHEVQQRILNTPGVTGLSSYSSQVAGRAFTINATVDTLYGQVQITEIM